MDNMLVEVVERQVDNRYEVVDNTVEEGTEEDNTEVGLE